MGKGYWVIRTYKAGEVGEKIKYWVPGEKPTKSARRLKSEIKKAQQNEASAEKEVARLINANFAKGDYLIGLDYSADGMAQLQLRAESIGEERARSGRAYEDSTAERDECIRTAAQQEMVNWIRRVKRVCDRGGIEFRYIAITSDMDGETGEAVRVHHHLVINAEALPACEGKWRAGGIEYSPLSGQADYTGIAHYFMAQVRRIPNGKKYTPSRNLKRPVPKDRIATNGAELRVPKNGALLFRNEFRPGMPQYIRYILPYSRE